MRPLAAEALKNPWFCQDNASTSGTGTGSGSGNGSVSSCGSYSSEEKGVMAGTVFSNTRTLSNASSNSTSSGTSSSSSVVPHGRRKGGSASGSPTQSLGGGTSTSRIQSPPVCRTHSPTTSSGALSSMNLSAP